MRRGLCTIALVVGVAGCGGSSAPSLALNAYAVRGNEEPGYAAESTHNYATPHALGMAEQMSATQQRRLGQEGFKGAVVVQTGASQPGTSIVYELGSAAAAAREVRAQAAGYLHAKGAARFSDSSIPGSIGFAYPAGGAANVLFQEGRCVLLVGDEDSGASGYRQPAIAGANAIWKRTHERAGACST